MSPTSLLAELVTGKAACCDPIAFFSYLTEHRVGTERTDPSLMISQTSMSRDSLGAFAGRIGMPLFLIATAYKDGVKKFATYRETITAMIIGTKMLIAELVSSIMTTSEYVMRQ